jgi:hypothetical protein
MKLRTTPDLSALTSMKCHRTMRLVASDANVSIRDAFPLRAR